jgi:hypothetical protein
MTPFLTLLWPFMFASFGIGVGVAFTIALLQSHRKPTGTLILLSAWIVFLIVCFVMHKNNIDFTK